MLYALFTMFLPTTREEMNALGWDRPDVILVTGDSYIDHPSSGAALICRVLMDAGFRTAVIAQPDVSGPHDITRLGEPRLFWGVTGGSVDSMVANYTASGKRRKSDDNTPGGINNRRPDRALIAYTNLIKRFFKGTCPVVLGGIEASARRIAHYDFWSDSIRRSVLFDAKADILVYGMGEKAVLELARSLRERKEFRRIRGICYAANEKPPQCTELPSFSEAARDKDLFLEMFRSFSASCADPGSGALCQLQDTRYLVQNPPQPLLTTSELDMIYDLEFERGHHPFYEKMGSVKALETIRFSITTHRGCFGGCSFCSIGVHQGRSVISRSRESIIREAQRLIRHPEFRGVISDLGGPTANMYAMGCGRNAASPCKVGQCLFPGVCASLETGHKAQIELLRAIRSLPGVKKAFVASGVRHDLVMADAKYGECYLEELVKHHISGQMKIAPEHTSVRVLDLMGKPGNECLIAFKDLFYRLTRKHGKKQFLTYYLMAAHPGCTLDDMQELKRFATSELRTNPEQVQIFTPLPSTRSAAMYHAGKDPCGKHHIFVEKDRLHRQRQKDVLTARAAIGKPRRPKP
ncbi:MAG: YgiQ family radical SAM protein [Desulfomonilia bacterium]